MEFRRCQDQALVLQKGVLFGCLLLLQGRSLRRVHPEELSIEGLDHAVVQPGTLIPLRRRFVVYKGGEIQFWRCQRCSFENSSSDFGCKLCGSPPSCPQDLPQEGRRLGLAGVAALRSRFAMRPQLHWAVQLKCPLCRIAAVALVVPVPLLDQAPKEWFDLVSQQKSTISQSDLAQGLSVILPLVCRPFGCRSPTSLRALGLALDLRRLPGRGWPRAVGLPSATRTAERTPCASGRGGVITSEYQWIIHIYIYKHVFSEGILERFDCIANLADLSSISEPSYCQFGVLPLGEGQSV